LQPLLRSAAPVLPLPTAALLSRHPATQRAAWQGAQLREGLAAARGAVALAVRALHQSSAALVLLHIRDSDHWWTLETFTPSTRLPGAKSWPLLKSKAKLATSVT